jgi:2-keto-4-pentenoate hydratase/2-oxohepta-3-ene-1,7-dioic acid hydratase in catechol pathway
MKLSTFEVATRLGRFRRLGAVTSAGVVDLNFTAAVLLARRGEARPERLAGVLAPNNLLEFLEEGELAMALARQAVEAVQGGVVGEGLHGETVLWQAGEARMLAPLPNPPSLRDFYAFEQHVKTGFERRGEPMPREWYEIPAYYKSEPRNILGPEDDVLWPSFTEKFDYELELAAVIGKRGRNVPAAEARSYIAGFTVMNDFSARDIQRREMAVRLGPAKGKDWATALGPVLTTTEEIGDPYNLRMTARVNGETWSEGNSGSIYWKFEQMVEFLSRDDNIYPGDVIGSGTVGTGCGLELNRWVRPGDVIELEIEKIGVLRNRVTKP